MTFRYWLYWLAAFVLLGGFALDAAAQPSLRVSGDDRHLVYADGAPFFWLGDTAWELFHRLDREEARLYLENRAAKGFTVIQAVALAELDGLHTPNPYGETPLVGDDPAQPNEAYFEHVDFVVDLADSLGLFVGLLPTWGDKFNRKWGVGPEVFTPENARAYGRFLGERYRDAPVIWILGGDRIPEEEEDFAIVRAMAEGIREGDGGRHLMTYHPQGGYTSADFFHGDDWLDLNLFQSGHGEKDNRNHTRTQRDRARTPVKPVLDGEPNYEDHPINWRGENGWFDEFDSRRAGYWSMLAGAAGHTYGNHNIWQMWQPGREPISVARTPWREALDYPGAFQAGIMRRVFETRPWQQLEPAQELLLAGPNSAGREVMVAADSLGRFLMAYTPYGSTLTLSLEPLQGERFHVWWVNPRDGHAIDAGVIDRAAEHAFDPPADDRRGNDWLLVLDDVAAGFGAPAVGE